MRKIPLLCSYNPSTEQKHLKCTMPIDPHTANEGENDWLFLWSGAEKPQPAWWEGDFEIHQAPTENALISVEAYEGTRVKMELKVELDYDWGHALRLAWNLVDLGGFMYRLQDRFLRGEIWQVPGAGKLYTFDSLLMEDTFFLADTGAKCYIACNNGGILGPVPGAQDVEDALKAANPGSFGDLSLELWIMKG